MRNAFLFCLLSITACGPYMPPHTSKANGPPSAGGDEAKLNLIWAPTRCDAAGYFTFALEDGTFVGNLARGQRLITTVPKGAHRLVTWNPRFEETQGRPSLDELAMLDLELSAGETYYARLEFGDWGTKGPSRTAERGTRPCSGSQVVVVAMTPHRRMAEIPHWVSELTPVVPNRAEGQLSLDREGSVRTHVLLATTWFEQLSPSLRTIAHLGKEDGRWLTSSLQ